MSAPMSTEELKPENENERLLSCPFCGPGQSQVDTWFDEVPKRWRVSCGRCGSSSGMSVHAEGSKEAAIASWNKRGIPAQSKPEPAEIEALKHDIERLQEINNELLNLPPAPAVPPHDSAPNITPLWVLRDMQASGSWHGPTLKRAIENLEALDRSHSQEEKAYVVWSNEHHCWWRADSKGYTIDVRQAGLYTRTEAIEISHKGRDGWQQFRIPPDEIAVAVSDLPEAIQADVRAKR